MALDFFGLFPEPIRTGTAPPELAQQVCPFVVELPRGDRQRRDTPAWADLAGVECVAPGSRFRMNLRQKIVDGRDRHRMGPKALQLRMMAVAPRPAAQYRTRQQRLTPKRHQPLRVQIPRMQGPQSHVTTAIRLQQLR